MRLFIAINWGAETRGRLIALREELHTRSQRGSFSRDENLHLTLAFLGECDAKQTAAAKSAMNAVRFEPFSAVIDRIGRFKRDGGKRVSAKSRDFVEKGATTEQASFSPLGGNEREQSVATWWAGVQASKPLINLQSDLMDKLIDAGFALENRKYSPHITLGREIVTDSALWQFEPFEETVLSIELMKSERIGGKLTYTAIFEKRGRENEITP